MLYLLWAYAQNKDRFGGTKMSTLFVRERRQIGPGAGHPRFAIVAALGTDLRIFARHVRKAELEKLAEVAGVEIVYLPRGANAEDDDINDGGRHRQGQGRGTGRRRGGRGAMDQE
jgi:hypothetical protein